MIFLTKPPGFKPRGTTAAVAVICSTDNRVLGLTRHPDSPQGNKVGLPAGGVEEGETVREAAARELREETGIEVHPDDLEYDSTWYVQYPEFDFVYEQFYLYVDKHVAVTRREDEHVADAWYTFQELLAVDFIQHLDDVLEPLMCL